jgi:hypothetical protein
MNKIIINPQPPKDVEYLDNITNESFVICKSCYDTAMGVVARKTYLEENWVIKWQTGSSSMDKSFKSIKELVKYFAEASAIDFYTL